MQSRQVALYGALGQKQEAPGSYSGPLISTTWHSSPHPHFSNALPLCLGPRAYASPEGLVEMQVPVQ